MFAGFAYVGVCSLSRWTGLAFLFGSPRWGLPSTRGGEEPIEFTKFYSVRVHRRVRTGRAARVGPRTCDTERAQTKRGRMSIYVCLLVALLGVIVYGFSNNGKAAEVGRIAYMVGLFVFLFQIVGKNVVNPFK
jgi:hypothetical protein